MTIPELRMVMSTDPLVADEKVFVIFNSELHAIDADTGKKFGVMTLFHLEDYLHQ